MVGGNVWIENIKAALKSSRVIITLLTKFSIKSHWVYFESGVGFTEDKTIPLLTDNLQLNDLFPPLSLVQSRVLTEQGIQLLVNDISLKLNQRSPSHYPGLQPMITETAKYLQNRSVIELRELINLAINAPNLHRQWIYKNNCLVHDYIINDKFKIAVDTYFYSDGCVIELFGRDSESGEFLFNTMCKMEDFLPRPLSSFERKERLIYQRFVYGDDVSKVAKSLSDLLDRIERYLVTSLF